MYNRCNVLYVYVDITVQVWQKVNGTSHHLPVKVLKSNPRIRCGMCSNFLKKTLARRQSIILVHLIISSGSSLIYNTSARHKLHECITSDTNATQVTQMQHKWHKFNTSNTSATQEQHECYTNDTSATRELWFWQQHE